MCSSLVEAIHTMWPTFVFHSEHLFKVQAEEMVKKGFLAAGYEYIIIDDCWLSHDRDENGKLQPDPKRFPSGIKELADYVNSLKW